MIEIRGQKVTLTIYGREATPEDQAWLDEVEQMVAASIEENDRWEWIEIGFGLGYWQLRPK